MKGDKMVVKESIRKTAQQMVVTGGNINTVVQACRRAVVSEGPGTQTQEDRRNRTWY